MTSSDPRVGYRAGAEAFVSLVRTIGASSEVWAQPGLGEWDVRALVGHLSRSFTTVLEYLDPETRAEHPTITSPVAYYQTAMQTARANPEAVTQRGRDAGAGLGDDPLGVITDLATRATGAAEAAADDALVSTPWGTMNLLSYLPTRTFELAVHSLDLAGALAVEAPVGLQPVLADALVLATDLAAAAGQGPQVLRALTGRGDLVGYSVV